MPLDKLEYVKSIAASVARLIALYKIILWIIGQFPNQATVSQAGGFTARISNCTSTNSCRNHPELPLLAKPGWLQYRFAFRIEFVDQSGKQKVRISHKYKFIFFCNPKTGSESVRKIITPYSDVIGTSFLQRTPINPFYSHITPNETKFIFKKFGWDFNSYRKFVFVRNPWARLVSLYEMILRLDKAPDKLPIFTEWVHTIKPNGTGGGGEDWQRWRKYGSYSLDNFCKDNSGELLVDKIIRLEDIDRDLIPYLNNLSLPDIEKFTVPHINKSVIRNHYTEYYNDEAALHVAELYRFDIGEFGYEFGRDTE